MSVITLFEDSTRNIADYNIPHEDLVWIQQQLGGNVTLDVNGNLRIMHYVGFVQKNNTRIQVLPKIYSTVVQVSENDEMKEAFNFLFTMLSDTGYLSCKTFDASYYSTHKRDLFELLIQIYIIQFQKVLRKNWFNDYVSTEENSPFIKGKIDFQQTIRKNAVYRHLHFQSFDEFTINNPLLIFLKGTSLRLLKISRDSTNKKLLEENVTFLEDVSDDTLSEALINTIQFNRRNREFKPVYNLAKLFYNRSIAGLQGGTENTFSFLLELNKLFEEYVGVKLNKFNDSSRKFTHHKDTIGVLVRNNETSLLNIKPDFTYRVNGNVTAILDAKYKEAVYSPSEGGTYILRGDDIYQLITYASFCGCRIIVPIYPKFKGVRSNTEIGRFQVLLQGNILTLIPIQVELGTDEDFKKIVEVLEGIAQEN
jgi:5-methylcytosine-specific restriction enzyme subunit McrC